MKCNSDNYLKSYKEVRSLVFKIREERNIMPIQEYFRGQVSDTYSLIPSLSRKFSDHVALIKVERLIMEDFKKEIEANNKIDKLLLRENPLHFQNDWAWLVQAQHYRLPTRMLDWTLCWEVALYFAVEEQYGDKAYFNSHDSQFWVFYVPDEFVMLKDNQDSYYRVDPYNFCGTGFLNPSLFWTNNYKNEIAERRKARQQGKFSIQSSFNSMIPLEQQRDINQHLKKFLIPSDSKEQIRLDLAKEGITGEFLYVDDDEMVNRIILSLKDKYGLN